MRLRILLGTALQVRDRLAIEPLHLAIARKL